jgi:hypothetical protein
MQLINFVRVGSLFFSNPPQRQAQTVKNYAKKLEETAKQ